MIYYLIFAGSEAFSSRRILVRNLIIGGFAVFIKVQNIIEFSKSRENFVHADERGASAKVLILFESSPMKVGGAVAFLQNFFVGCFKEAITDVVSKRESSPK